MAQATIAVDEDDPTVGRKVSAAVWHQRTPDSNPRS